MIDILLITIKFFTLLPLTILLVKQFINIILRPATNGLAKTRKVLLTLTVAIWTEVVFFAIYDIHALILGVGRLEWITQAQLAVILVRIIMLYAVWRFYRLLYQD